MKTSVFDTAENGPAEGLNNQQLQDAPTSPTLSPTSPTLSPTSPPAARHSRLHDLAHSVASVLSFAHATAHSVGDAAGEAIEDTVGGDAATDDVDSHGTWAASNESHWRRLSRHGGTHASDVSGEATLAVDGDHSGYWEGSPSPGAQSWAESIWFGEEPADPEDLGSEPPPSQLEVISHLARLFLIRYHPDRENQQIIVFENHLSTPLLTCQNLTSEFRRKI